MADFFLSDAGSLFFAIWTAVIAALSVAAFGRELLPGYSEPAFTPVRHDPPSSRESLNQRFN
jgi:hypothetical protein